MATRKTNKKHAEKARSAIFKKKVVIEWLQSEATRNNRSFSAEVNTKIEQAKNAEESKH